MTDLSFDVSLLPSAPRGRTIKFTPERMNQIRNLVERGMNRHEIAETIGVTVGSLQVTCSKAGVSLRRPKEAVPMVAALPRPLVPVTPPTAPAPRPSATFALRMQCGDVHRDIPLPLTMEAIATLAVAAEVKGLRMADLIAKVVTAAVKQGAV